MKNTILLFTSLFFSVAALAQLSPAETSEFCPTVEYSFTLQVPGDYSSVTLSYQFVAGSSQGVAGNGTTSTASFKLTFQDANNVVPQVTVSFYGKSGTLDYELKFPHVKSMTYGNYSISSLPASLSVSPCVTTPINFSFVPIQWINNAGGTTTKFGSVTTYDYIIPAGWSIGGHVSTGPTDIIQASNSVTIVPDGLTGGQIQVRAANHCTANLIQPLLWQTIPITGGRPIPSLTANGNTTLNLSCGVVQSTTFALQNVSGISCITSYEWNLGANNGWTYLGSAAPATISTSGNSVILSNTCGSVPQNILLKVYNGSALMGSFPFTVSYSSNLPSLSISGPPNVCSSSPQNYTLGSLPCDATVVWSTEPSGYATVVSNLDGSGTVSHQADGDFVLKATVSSACGSIVVQRSVRAGTIFLNNPYGSFTFETNSGTNVTHALSTVNNFYGFTYSTTNGLQLIATVSQTGVNGYWTLNEATGPNADVLSFNSYGNTFVARFNQYSLGDKTFRAVFNYYDNCSGWLSYTHWFNYTGSSAPSISGKLPNTTETKGKAITMGTVHPNPVTNKLTIDVGLQAGATISIYGMDGKLVIRTQEKNAQLDVSALKPGVYLLRSVQSNGKLLSTFFVKSE